MFESIEFQVIGELKDDPGHLLLLDRDGQCYDYDLSRDDIVPVEPNGTWRVDVIENAGLVVEALVERVAS